MSAPGRQPGWRCSRSLSTIVRRTLGRSSSSIFGDVVAGSILIPRSRWTALGLDGTRIAFSGANTEAGGPGHSYGLYVMSARTRRVRLVYEAPRGTFEFNPSWSPDGRRLAFHGGGGPWVVRIDGRGARKLAANLGVNPWEPPAWSPDGRKLAFGAFNGRDSVLYTVRTRGRPRLRRITRKQTRSERAVEAGVSSPAWAPDGRWIAFERFGFASGLN